MNVSKTVEYNDLGQFVGQQRYFYRRNLKGETTSLTEERIKTLSDLGFEWKSSRNAPTNSVTLKEKDNTLVVEKDNEITLPDGSNRSLSSKESSQKRMVLLEDGSHALETITKTYTTKIESISVPPEVAQSLDFDINTKSSTESGGDSNIVELENKVTYPDGSTVEYKTQETCKKQARVLPIGSHLRVDGTTHLLETITKTSMTKIETTRIPSETEMP